MAVYFVTGKLGSGKTLISVSRIKEVLFDGRAVATNIDINLRHMLGPNKKHTRLFRLPDKPSADDLRGIGVGNKTYDENKNGLLVLDECGTWFNSRSWADKNRQDVINWFLHARKLGWDIIFLVQDLSIVDKQARLALAEHVVYCRRTDRANIPFLGGLFKLLTASRLPLPKVHLGIVKYGDQQNSLKVDTWSCLAPALYGSYDTKQTFSDNYDAGLFTVLPPFYTHGRYQVEKNWRNIMRITKIYFKKYSRITAFFTGILLASSVTAYALYEAPEEIKREPTQENFLEKFADYKIRSYSNFHGQKPSYEFVSLSDSSLVTSKSLILQGITVKSRGHCEAVLVKGDDHVSIFCR